MLEKVPCPSDMTALVGKPLFDVWQKLCAAIDEKYDMEREWNSGGKKWTYEYKYRRGGKTLCALYAKEKCIGLMVIFGQAEREKFEAQRKVFSDALCKTYDDAQTYHDGKWMMFEPCDTTLFDEYLMMLAIKRKPNKKGV